ncbi:Phage-related baseplate assembly protein [Acetobacter malorum]|uniref:Phage-related baseplate assembly protein n=1 Tax=Acetobacter malorum TaxID=178901 RepID=A0A177G6Q7_9PROT|nr:Phage-related baseplate assembly protein [Acetobacter malorum]
MTDMRVIAYSVTGMIGAAHHGLISAVDPTTHDVKVKLQPGGNETGWLPFAAMQVGDLRIACPPNVGTQVHLTPVDGDPEHSVVASPVFCVVMTPPISPATGKPAQPGEYLLMAGCGAPPVDEAGRDAGKAADSAPWMHVTRDTFYSGVGKGATATISDGQHVWKAGGVTATLSASGFSVSGGNITTDKDVQASGDVKTSSHSLNGHIHTNGNNGSNTGGPVG